MFVTVFSLGLNPSFLCGRYMWAKLTRIAFIERFDIESPFGANPPPSLNLFTMWTSYLNGPFGPKCAVMVRTFASECISFPAVSLCSPPPVWYLQ